MSDEGLPPLATISLDRVFRLKKKLITVLEDGFVGALVRGPLLHELVDEVQNALPGTVHEEVIFDSLRHLGGTVLTDPIIRQESWRLAGNIHRLKQHYPAPPWMKQEFDEWVPVQVIDCKVKRTIRIKKIGGEFTARILGGTSTGLLAHFFWTHGFCGNFSRHVGFTPPWKSLPFKKCEEFVGLRFYGLCESSRPGQEIRRVPHFHHVKDNPTLTNYNKGVLRKRARMEGFKCPFNYKHPCYRCHVGYRDCPVALHPETFVKEHCIVCNKEGWFEQAMIPLGVCVACQKKRDLGHH
jgi:hypothetical protein